MDRVSRTQRTTSRLNAACSGSLAPNAAQYRVPIAPSDESHQMLLALALCAAPTTGPRSPDPAGRAPADPTRGGCSHTRRRTAPAAAPRSSTTPAARATADRQSPRPRSTNSPAGSSVDGTSSNTASTSSTSSVAMSSPNSIARRALGARHLIGAVDQRRHLAREHALRFALFRRARRHRRELLDRRALEEREELQVRHHLAIVGVQPELIEAERRGAIGIEPDRAGFRLAELDAAPPSSSAARPGRAPSSRAACESDRCRR